jgi:TPR repeat protein
VEATKWFREAASQGHSEAQIIIATCYMMGEGVPSDLEQAVHWWRKAAEQGHPHALARMGFCFDRGEGVERDPIEAYAYYKLAGMQIELHPMSLPNLEETMSNEEIVVGKMRTKELLKEINTKIAAKKAGK